MLLGLTGCSGTGASTVAHVWKQMGAYVCSLDEIGHRLLDKPSVKSALEIELGIHGLSGMEQKDIRHMLREKAFTSKTILTGINRIMHPRLKIWVAASAENLQKMNGVFVLDAALIFELDLEKYFSCVVTVADQLERVIGRLTVRDGITSDTVIGRWNSQLGLDQKCMQSHFVISNTDSESALKTNAENFYNNVIRRMEEKVGT